MDKKVVVISSSPRKEGNSDLLCDEFIKGAESAGNKAVKHYIGSEDIGFCRGCYACMETKACIQEDIMTEILEDMVNSDVIVLASPVYFYSISGQLKTFIDRVLPKYEEIKDKDVYFIGTCGEGRKEALDTPIKDIEGFVSCLDNSRLSGVIYGTGVNALGEVKDKNSMSEAYRMGSEIK